MRNGINWIKLFIIPLIVLQFMLLSACQPQGSLHTSDQVEETDYGCAYFYFLWGRQAELALRFEEALEAYEKALICDPEADYIIRKIPILLLRMNRGEEAVTMLQDYLKNKPLATGVRMLLARVYIGLGHYQKAAGEYRVMHRQNPKEVSALLLLSELYLNQKKLKEAEQVLKELLVVNTGSYPAHVMLARIYLVNKEYQAAVAEYRKALDIDWSVDLVMEMSDVYAQQKDYDTVVSLYRQILEKDQQNEMVSLALINFLLLQNKEKEALDELNRLKALAEEPGSVDLSMARLYARLEKYDQSIEILRNYLSGNNASDARYLLAVILAQAEKYEQALSELQLIDRDEEEYEDAVIFQVRILRFLDRTDQAVDVLEKAIQFEESRSPDMYVMLAALYQLQGKSDLGKSTFDRALSAFPDNDELLYEYGLFLDTLGSKEEAMSLMQEVIKRQPEHGEALNYVGYSWADKSIHLDKALLYIQRAVHLKPDNGYMHDSLGWVYYRMGRIDEARQALEEAVRLTENDPIIYDHLGDVYLELGRKKDALEAYNKASSLIEEDSGAKKALQDKIKLLEDQEKQR
ncbi:MAG: tetratricopeptide repeat protein [Desulfobulbaceae bacterium]|nr:tetratricopeptide repeat protein [Desulfobulbaceae bacterium]